MTSTIERIFLKQGKYAPGDTVQIGVELKPYRRDPIVRTIGIKIPADTPSSIIGAICGYLSLWSVYHLYRLLTGKEGMMLWSVHEGAWTGTQQAWSPDCPRHR